MNVDGIKVTYQEMEDAAKRFHQDAGEMTNMLSGLTSMVQNLLQDGFVTKEASPEFERTYNELKGGSEQVNEALDGIGTYLEKAVEALKNMDSELANALKG